MSLATTGAIVGIAGTAYGAHQQSQMAGKAGKDPFGKHNRKMYQMQLRDLMADPSSIFRSDPFRSALDVGLTGVEKKMAAQGFLGSGNEAAALMGYGESFALNFFENQRDALAQLAGSGMQPSYGAAVAGAGNAADLWGNAAYQTGILGQRLMFNTDSTPGYLGAASPSYVGMTNPDAWWN